MPRPVSVTKPPPPPASAVSAAPARKSASDGLSVKVRCGGPVHATSSKWQQSGDICYAGLKKTSIATAQQAVFGTLGTGLVQLCDSDTFFELGCGHGEVLIAARSASLRCRCIGVELDPESIAKAKEAVAAYLDSADANAQPIMIYHASLDDCLREPDSDMNNDTRDGNGAEHFPPHLSQATVVYMYIGQWANLKLRPTLLRVLPIGAKIITQSFTMGDAWTPDSQSLADNGQVFYLYTVTAERKADPVLNSDRDLSKHFGFHWTQPPPNAYQPIPHGICVQTFSTADSAAK